MSSPYGPAQGIVDMITQAPRKLVDTVTQPVDKVNEMLQNLGLHLPGLAPAVPPPQDTSWHDSMVKQANQSHADHQIQDMKRPLK